MLQNYEKKQIGMKKTGDFAIKHLISQRNRNFAKNNPMEVIRYINCCIVEFGQRLGLEPKWACRYLYLHGGLELLDKNYQAEHLLPLDDTIDDLISYCKRHGGTLE